jgi:hypothetical protein
LNRKIASYLNRKESKLLNRKERGSENRGMGGSDESDGSDGIAQGCGGTVSGRTIQYMHAYTTQAEHRLRLHKQCTD